MAVPKKKQSKTRTAKRRANWKAKPPAVQPSARSASSPSCPHRVCGNCGYYAGRQAVEVE